MVDSDSTVVVPILGKLLRKKQLETDQLRYRLQPRARVCVCVSPPVSKGSTFVTKSFECRGPSPSPVADGQRRGHWGGLQTYLPNCCTSCHSTLSLFVSMVVHATSPKPFPSPLARVVVAPLQMRNLNVKTPSSLWTFHHAVPSPSFPSWARARVVVAPLQMRNLNVKTPSSLWTFHHAVPSPSFPSWARARRRRTTADEKPQYVKTPSSLWTFHHAVPSPSFPSWARARRRRTTADEKPQC